MHMPFRGRDGIGTRETDMDNIERSAFRQGQYVGYSARGLWRISPIVARLRTGRVKRIGWSAVNTNGAATSGPYTLQAHTLRELSAKLARLS